MSVDLLCDVVVLSEIDLSVSSDETLVIGVVSVFDVIIGAVAISALITFI